MNVPGPRPQPLGALPWPAGMLLLPDTPGAHEVVATLVAGGIPAAWPDDISFMELALDEDIEGAYAEITGDTLVDRYNRAVLLGGEGVWEALAEETDGEFRCLVDTLRFTVGATDAPPIAAEGRGEVRAIARSACASAAMEQGDFAAAVADIRDGAEAADEAGSPVLAASLRLTSAELQRDRLGDAANAAREADFAIQRLPLTVPRELRGELQVARALARQELAGNDRGALLAVVADLNEAVKIFREETHPEMFATINEHLALAYLVMPMTDEGDRIRLGVAVTSLRAALRVFTPETHPVAWASAQLNLANALQYLPSVHQESNLDEAVQLYEEVLQRRHVEDDPLGVARILINQGNALGHLGVFSDARTRLTRARELFQSNGDADGVATAEQLLAEVDAAERKIS